VEVESTPLDRTVDPFTMLFEPTSAGADLVLQWERTEVRIPIAEAPAGS
jgi:hypothetical protein